MAIPSLVYQLIICYPSAIHNFKVSTHMPLTFNLTVLTEQVQIKNNRDWRHKKHHLLICVSLLITHQTYSEYVTTVLFVHIQQYLKQAANQIDNKLLTDIQQAFILQSFKVCFERERIKIWPPQLGYASVNSTLL